jgi:hypothetical protein
MSDDVIAIFTRERVRIVIFASHTTYIFKMLDMVLFYILKKYDTGLETLDEESQAAAFLFKVYRDFKQMIVEINISGTFAAIEFIHDINQIPYGLLFDTENFRQRPGFVELWERNMPSERRESIKATARIEFWMD